MPGLDLQRMVLQGEWKRQWKLLYCNKVYIYINRYVGVIRGFKRENGKEHGNG